MLAAAGLAVASDDEVQSGGRECRQRGLGDAARPVATRRGRVCAVVRQSVETDYLNGESRAPGSPPRDPDTGQRSVAVGDRDLTLTVDPSRRRAALLGRVGGRDRTHVRINSMSEFRPNNQEADPVTTVDVHAHFAPPSLAVAAANGNRWQGFDVARDLEGAIGLSDGSRTFSLPKWSGTDSIDQRLQRMDATGVDVQALSVTWRMYQYDAPMRQATDSAAQINDDLAAVVGEHPGRFWGLAQLPLQDPAASIRELERWMAVDGMVGAAVGTDVHGVEWDDPSLFPVLEAAESLGALVFFHPADRRRIPASPASTFAT